MCRSRQGEAELTCSFKDSGSVGGTVEQGATEVKKQGEKLKQDGKQ